LAGTTLQKFKTILTNAITGGNSDWFQDTTINGRDMMYRFQGSTYPTKPLTAAGLARVSPVLLQHCSQFIVEYAGDFLEQDNNPSSPTYGEVMDTVGGDGDALQPDGQIDFIVNKVTHVKSIRWSGFPRDTSSNSPAAPGRPDGVIQGFVSGRTNNDLPDVVPLRDVALTSSAIPSTFPGYFPFERNLPARLPPKTDYASRSTNATFGLALDARYLCAWGPDTPGASYPTLIRFVFTIDDPTGRLPEGQTFEYVFRVGG
jgi:hypothetical protein